MGLFAVITTTLWIAITGLGDTGLADVKGVQPMGDMGQYITKQSLQTLDR